VLRYNSSTIFIHAQRTCTILGIFDVKSFLANLEPFYSKFTLVISSKSLYCIYFGRHEVVFRL